MNNTLAAALNPKWGPLITLAIITALAITLAITNPAH